MISLPAVARRQEENKAASQQSKPFRLNKVAAGLFQENRFSLPFKVKLLFDENTMKKTNNK